MARSTQRRPRGGEATMERPSKLRLWLRRRKALLRPGLQVLAVAALLGVAGMGVLALDPAGRFTWLTTRMASMGQSFGLVVEEVTVEGRRHASQAQLLQAVGVQRGDAMLDFSPQAAQRRLEALGWVASAHVERHLPGSILVRIVEREPYAVWQIGNQARVIDAEGRVLSDDTESLPLPRVQGSGANMHARRMIELLRSMPELRDRTAEMIRVGNRRWSLRLHSGTEVKLPGGLEEAALRRLAEQQASIGLLDRPVAVIDLRLPDRLTVQVSAPVPPAPQEPAVQRVRSTRG